VILNWITPALLSVFTEAHADMRNASILLTHSLEYGMGFAYRYFVGFGLNNINREMQDICQL
jgi:hypothetical protein